MSDFKKQLPQYYDNNIIGFYPQGPDTLFVYWELSLSCWQTVAGLGGAFVRVYEVRETEKLDYDYNLVREVQPPPHTENWYFDGLEPGGMYCVEIGGKLEDGSFFPLIKSDKVQAPPVPAFNITPGIRAACPNSLEKPAGNRGVGLNEKKDKIEIELEDIFREMPFYMGYIIQLAG